MEKYYMMDDQAMVINEGRGTESREEAIANFRNNYTKAEAEEYGITLNLLAEENGQWTECLEEISYEEIYG